MIRPLRRCKEIYAISLIFTLFILFSTQTFGQAIGDYRSQGTGNWATRGIWQICTSLTPVTWATPSTVQGYPGQFNTSANVTIWNSNVVTFNSPIGPTIASLQIGSATDGTSGGLIFNNGRLLTVAGTVTIGNAGTLSSGTVSMTNGGTFSVSNISVSNSAGSSFTPGAAANTDTVQFNATNTLPTTVFTSFNNIAFSGGTTTAAAGFSAAGSIIINSTATFNAGGFTHSVGGNWVNNGGAFIATGSTIDFNGVAANNTIGGLATSQTFNNIIVDKTGFTLNVTTALSSSFTVGGTLSVLNGTFNMQNAGPNTFAGLVTLNTGTTWNRTGNAAVNIQSGITSHGTFNSGNGIYTFDTRNQDLRGLVAIKNVTISGGFTVTNNDTLTNATNLTGAGTLTQAANALLNLGGTISVGTLVNTNTGNTVNYTGASQTILPQNYYNLTLSGSGTAIMQTGTTAIAGNFTTSGTVRTTTADNLTIAGDLSIGNGTILTVGGFSFNVSGSTTVGTGASGRLAFSSAAGTKTFIGLIRVNNGGSWVNNTANSDIFIKGGITNVATFTAGSGLYTFNTNNQDLFGTFSIPNVTVTTINLNNNDTLTVATTLAGSGALVQMSNAVLNLAGTSGITSLLATNSGNTVNYTGGAQTVFATNYYHLGLGGNSTKTLQTGTTIISGNLTFSGTTRATAVVGLTIGGNLNLFGTNNGRTFTAGSFLTHNIAGNFVNNNAFTAGTSTMVFNGTAPQTIGGTVATTFANLTISNASGVSLDDGTNAFNKTVGTNITLLVGYLTTTTTNLLVLNQGATATVANAAIEAGGAVLVPQSNSPYINGPMRKIGTQAFTFPVGSVGTGCVPIGISAPGSATDAFDALYLRSSAAGMGSITGPNLFTVSACEHWTLEHSSGTSTIAVTGYWNENSPCNGETAGHYVSDLTTISLAHYDTAAHAWNNNSTSLNSSTVGTTISGGITWSGVSAFSPFALGNNTGSKSNPLAIKLDYFSAVKADGYNKLSWQAECSTSANVFEAQSSPDAHAFTTIDTVLINNASDCATPSTYNDYASAGKNVYYRVKMTDASGVVNYSDVVFLSTAINAIDFIGIAPNPVKNDATLKISSSRNDKVELVILSLDGKVLQHSSIQVQAGANTVNLHAPNLAKGVYVVKGIFSGGQTHTIKFIKE